MSASVKSIYHQLSVDTAQWYAIRTGFRKEKVVSRRLAAKNIQVFLPLLNVLRRYKSKNKRLEVPLINTYLFVRIKQDEYISVLDTIDVHGYVKLGAQLSPVREEEIAVLKRIVGDDIDVEIHEGASLSIGDPVEIATGQLAGVKGELIDIKGKKTFVVALESLGLSLRIEVESTDLRKRYTSQ